MNGIYVNDLKVFDKEGKKYAYYAHRLTFDDVSALQPGTNKIKTGKAPLYDGAMAHGMEVQWPSIMLLVRYDKTIKTTVNDASRKALGALLLKSYPNPFNGSTRIHYKLPKKEKIELSVFNPIGQKCATLANSVQQTTR